MQHNQLVYNEWAEQYDSNRNRTRDLEATALQEILGDRHFSSVLELGCGTGKNTSWLAERTVMLTAVDFSEDMLAKARQKTVLPHVTFYQADIASPWVFTGDRFDLITFSLVLEHIEDLGFVFSQAQQKLAPGGILYVGELHPFKQYTGTVARFNGPEGQVEAECFTHHLSDFFSAASSAGFRLRTLREWFDENDRGTPPRILTLLFDGE